MPPTLVNVAFGALVATALLGAAFDRRSVLVVAVAAALPDVDAVASLFLEGATNALLHTLFVPGIVTALVYWDAAVREESWLRRRYGWWGIRVAWVSLAAYVVAGVGVDLFGTEGVNLLYPFHDRFYAVTGQLLVSTQEGLVQTYAGTENGFLGMRSLGTTADHRVETWVNPGSGAGDSGEGERRVRLVESGWQAVVVVAAAIAVLTVRFGEER